MNAIKRKLKKKKKGIFKQENLMKAYKRSERPRDNFAKFI